GQGLARTQRPGQPAAQDQQGRVGFLVEQQRRCHPEAGPAIEISVVQQYCEPVQPYSPGLRGTPVLQLFGGRAGQQGKRRALPSTFYGLRDGVAFGRALKLPIAQRHAYGGHDGQQHQGGNGAGAQVRAGHVCNNSGFIGEPSCVSSLSWLSSGYWTAWHRHWCTSCATRAEPAAPHTPLHGVWGFQSRCSCSCCWLITWAGSKAPA